MTEPGTLEEEAAPTLGFLLQEPSEQREKTKRYDTRRRAPSPLPRSEGTQHVIREEQRAITKSSRENEVVG